MASKDWDDAHGNRNLLLETLRVLKLSGKTPGDVSWVGSADGNYVMSWDGFAALAKDVSYDPGFGGQEIAPDLVVVGSDWWMERSEYDGSEWWDFKMLPTKKTRRRDFARLTCGGWGSIDDLNSATTEGGDDGNEG